MTAKPIAAHQKSDPRRLFPEIPQAKETVSTLRKKPKIVNHREKYRVPTGLKESEPTFRPGDQKELDLEPPEDGVKPEAKFDPATYKLPGIDA